METEDDTLDLFAQKMVNVIAVVEGSFGDSGKGKFVDVLAGYADATVRGTGGANAGHTIVHDGVTHVVHLLPSSILRDKEGKQSIIGRGTVVNPGALAKELVGLQIEGYSANGLLVCQDAQLVLPTHSILDHVLEASAGAGKIGTTKQGIGPAYADHRYRVGVRVNDLLNPDILAKNVHRSVEHARLILRGADPEHVRAAVAAVEGGLFGGSDIVDEDVIIAWMRTQAVAFTDCIADTDTIICDLLAEGKRVLLEGAQGAMLSIDYGTYPFVTSSDCTLAGLARGAGLDVDDVGYAVNVTKAYATRVGEGPFPTELFGEDADRLRSLGGEFGTTTNRPRRVGWMDLPLLRYGSSHASHYLALTKADVLNGYEQVGVCTEYRYEGPDIRIGRKVLTKGQSIQTAVPYPEVLEHCVPVIEYLPGWQEAFSRGNVHPNLDAFMKFVEDRADVWFDLLSTGRGRDEVVLL